MQGRVVLRQGVPAGALEGRAQGSLHLVHWSWELKAEYVFRTVSITCFLDSHTTASLNRNAGGETHMREDDLDTGGAD